MIDFDRLVLGPAMAAFGESVTFSPQNGPDQAIIAVFTERAKRQTFKDDLTEIEEITTLGCQQSQFSGDIPAENDEFTIRGILWRAAEVMPDGHGHITIHVMLANNTQANLTPSPAYG